MSDDLTLEKMKISERLTTLETKFTDIEPLIKDLAVYDEEIILPYRWQ